MNRLPMLSRKQMKVLQPLLPRARSLRCENGRWVISGIIYVIRNDLQWGDTSKGFEAHKTLYNRFIRWMQTRHFREDFHIPGSTGLRSGMPHDDRQHTSQNAPYGSLTT
ncbi:hypothetical protein NJLHNGOC_14515 [Novacetimonas cocois]|uniref:Insertion element IS402-like domain-containing protein n=1 Tax=Novacetimonas cocois TaxID=1747507 RepID=A0A365YQB5_9PROT|nr:transposase [Novacetimonas cocois]RBM04941.1 hypothetical protein NJLHNGOC_14515 [Novacetimonas cocois]